MTWPFRALVDAAVIRTEILLLDCVFLGLSEGILSWNIRVYSDLGSCRSREKQKFIGWIFGQENFTSRLPSSLLCKEFHLKPGKVRYSICNDLHQTSLDLRRA